LEDDKRFLAANLETQIKYTFGMGSMAPTGKTAGGETRVVDSTNFPVALNIAAAMVTIKPGGLREMHWHPTVSEWQYWIKGKGRMTVVTTEAKARRTMDFNANEGEDDQVVVAVQDSGTGFDPKIAELMFESFYTTKGEGLGMGLSISRSIVRDHGGRLWASTNKGPGGNFSIHAPEARLVDRFGHITVAVRNYSGLLNRL
jgi:hypothetical protein